MKRIGGLFDQIADRETLTEAAWAAAQGKRQRAEVKEFFFRFDHNLNQIGRRLRYGNYSFSDYRAFAIRDTKRRLIHAPPFRDRVVHHAIVAAVGDTLEKGAIDHSYACRTGKGQHRAVEAAAKWTRRAQWYGKIDVRKFYDSVDHCILMRLLQKRFREARLLALFERLLRSYETDAGKGIPIGALTSQYLGNFYLDGFDRSVTALPGVLHYLRYMDDCVLWVRTQNELREVRSFANDTLASLALEMKHGGEWNRCDQGIPFLGFVIYPDRIRLGKGGRKRLRMKFAHLSKAFREGNVSQLEAQAQATSLFSHALAAHDTNWRRVVLQFHEFGEGPGSTGSGAPRRRL